MLDLVYLLLVARSSPFHYNGFMPKKSVRKKTKLAVLVLLFIFTLILISRIVNFGRMFFKPWNLSQVQRSYAWDDRFSINLLIKAKSVALVSLNPSEKEVRIVNFPDNTFMDVAGGAGQWQVASIYNLGQSNGNKGRETLEQSISNFLAVPVDGFLQFSGSLANKEPAEIVQKFHQSLVSGVSDLSNIRTDLTLGELVRWKTNLASVRFDKIKEIELKGVLDQTRLNDGSQVYTTDPAKLDQILTDLQDPVIKNEHITIAVFNATSYPQLAQKAARLIGNLGGTVIVTANAEKSYSKTQVIGKKSATLTRLGQVFDLGCSKDPKCDKICPILVSQSGPACLKDPDVENSRAEVNIILGEDFYARQ